MYADEKVNLSVNGAPPDLWLTGKKDEMIPLTGAAAGNADLIPSGPSSSGSGYSFKIRFLAFLNIFSEIVFLFCERDMLFSVIDVSNVYA